MKSPVRIRLIPTLGFCALLVTLASPQRPNSAPKLKIGLPSFGFANSEYARTPAISPALTIEGLPHGTQAIAVSLVDPDAPSPFVHWLAANIPPTRRIPANVPLGDLPQKLKGGIQGTNSSGSVGYFGPKPPVGDKPHRYIFTIYALKEKLALTPRFDSAAFRAALAGRVLAQGTVVRTFGKS